MVTNNKFLKEIEEQPQALRQTLRHYQSLSGKNSLEKIKGLWSSGKYNKIVLTGMGSSFFVAQAGACLLNAHYIPAFAVNAGELLHYQMALLEKSTLFVFISQSGESFEIVRILEQVTTEMTILAITNEPGSTLAEKSSICLLCMAGKEEMTSTKTFISTYLVVYMLSYCLAGLPPESCMSRIENTASVVSDLLANRSVWLDKAVKTIAHGPFVQLVARGPVLAAAQQSALMIMEATRNPAAALAGGEFRHGPMEMVKEGFRAILFAPAGSTYGQHLAAVNDVLKFGGKVLMLTDKPCPLEHENLFVIQIPCINESFFAITSIIPVQLIVNQWSEEENNLPGNFTRGAKVTVVE